MCGLFIFLVLCVWTVVFNIMIFFKGSGNIFFTNLFQIFEDNNETINNITLILLL